MARPAAARGRGALALAVAAALARPGAGGAAAADEAGVGFRIVGSGSCRTASGKGGKTLVVQAKTVTDCERMCAEITACLGYEVKYDVSSATYDPGRAAGCELHTHDHIMQATKSAFQECWIKDGSTRRSDYALLGTGYCLPASLDRLRAEAWEVVPPGTLGRHYECRSACDADAACTAYELRQDSHAQKKSCKLYTEPVTQVEPCEEGRECWCWVARPAPVRRLAEEGSASQFW